MLSGAVAGQLPVRVLTSMLKESSLLWAVAVREERQGVSGSAGQADVLPVKAVRLAARVSPMLQVP